MVDTKWEWKERPLVMQLFQNGHYVASVPHEAIPFLKATNEREERLEALLVSIRQELDYSGVGSGHPAIENIKARLDDELGFSW